MTFQSIVVYLSLLIALTLSVVPFFGVGGFVSRDFSGPCGRVTCDFSSPDGCSSGCLSSRCTDPRGCLSDCSRYRNSGI